MSPIALFSAARRMKQQLPTIPRGPVADQFSTLVHRLRRLHDETFASGYVVGVTSTRSGEGVTSVASNLAMAACRAFSRQTLLVDANLRRPRIHKLFRSQLAPGLAEVVFSGESAVESFRRTSTEGLSCLSAGAASGRALDACPPAILAELITAWKQTFTLVVFDLPPASEASRFPLMEMLDGLLLVVEAERVKSTEALWAKRQLQAAGANVIGAVFNKRRLHIPGWLYRRV